MTYHFNLMN